jgi:hypothetical protein
MTRWTQLDLLEDWKEDQQHHYELALRQGEARRSEGVDRLAELLEHEAAIEAGLANLQVHADAEGITVEELLDRHLRRLGVTS